MTPTLADHLRDARARLEAAGIEPAEAAIDADVLARHALGGWERGQLLVHLRDEAPAGFGEAYAPLVARRATREPAAYITGTREFWNLEIEVTRDTLVPRPETELIVEEVLARLPRLATRAQDHAPQTGRPGLSIADVCTGTGCIAVALARWLPRACVVATDLSAAALAVARRNATRHDVAARTAFVRADLLDGVSGPFDVIVSNPPYMPTAELAAAPPEVREHEPAAALDGGADGLAVIRRLIPHAAARLAPGGVLVAEFGFGQGSAIRALLASEPRLALEAIRHDLAGIPRVLVARAAMSGSGSPVP